MEDKSCPPHSVPFRVLGRGQPMLQLADFYNKSSSEGEVPLKRGVCHPKSQTHKNAYDIRVHVRHAVRGVHPTLYVGFWALDSGFRLQNLKPCQGSINTKHNLHKL